MLSNIRTRTVYLSKNLSKTKSIIPNGARAFATTKSFYYDILQLNEMRNELRLSAEKFSQDEIAPLDEKADIENKFPPQLWKKLGDMGFLGMTAEE